MRLGKAMTEKGENAVEWAEKLKEEGYRAAVCPLDYRANDAQMSAYKQAAENYDIRIGEVGIWNNPTHPILQNRKEAIWYAKKQLALAEAIGANCCVNIGGSFHETLWYGPHPDNFSEEMFALIVETVQEIIDEVKPEHTFYTLEPSPWMYPDTIESYKELINGINRAQFAVHFDPVNMMYTPKNYYENGSFLKKCMQELGPYIKSCHIKDIYMDASFTLHIQERIPGEGVLDFASLIQALDELNPDMPAFLEHMEAESDYKRAAEFIRKMLPLQSEESLR